MELKKSNGGKMKMIDCPKAHRIHIFRKLVVSIHHNKVWFYCERCLKIIEKKFIE